MVAKTARSGFQSQNLNIPGVRRLHHIMAADTASVGLVVGVRAAGPTTAVEAYRLLQCVLAEARDHHSLPTAAEPTQRLLGSHTQQPEPIKLRPDEEAAVAAVADRRGSLLLLAATSSTSHRAAGPSADVQLLQQLQETMPVLSVGAKEARVLPGTPQVLGCSVSIQLHSCLRLQQKGHAARSHGIATGRQAASRRDSRYWRCNCFAARGRGDGFYVS